MNLIRVDVFSVNLSYLQYSGVAQCRLSRINCNKAWVKKQEILVVDKTYVRWRSFAMTINTSLAHDSKEIGSM